jgi:hypothetical protein
MVTGQGYGMGISGCSKLSPAATGLSLVAWFPCPCQLGTIRAVDGSQSQIYHPEYILAYESGKVRYSLVVGSGSFRTG